MAYAPTGKILIACSDCGSLFPASGFPWAAKVFQSFAAVIRVYDEGGNGIETHEHKGDFKEW
jgi:hypothetical protein